MARQISFTKFEQALRPEFRNRIGAAESTEDVKKFFTRTILQLLDQATGGQVAPRYEDVALNPEDPKGYTLAQTILSHQAFREAATASDLTDIIGRFAKTARKHWIHLSRNPEKTESKVYRA